MIVPDRTTDFVSLVSDGPVEPIPTTFVRYRNISTLQADAPGMTCGSVSLKPRTGVPIPMIVCALYRPGEIALIHSMSVDAARAMANSLNKLADSFQDAAGEQAEAALRKAAGK